MFPPPQQWRLHQCLNTLFLKKKKISLIFPHRAKEAFRIRSQTFSRLPKKKINKKRCLCLKHSSPSNKSSTQCTLGKRTGLLQPLRNVSGLKNRSVSGEKSKAHVCFYILRCRVSCRSPASLIQGWRWWEGSLLCLSSLHINQYHFYISFIHRLKKNKSFCLCLVVRALLILWSHRGASPSLDTDNSSPPGLAQSRRGDVAEPPHRYLLAPFDAEKGQKEGGEIRAESCRCLPRVMTTLTSVRLLQPWYSFLNPRKWWKKSSVSCLIVFIISVSSVSSSSCSRSCKNSRTSVVVLVYSFIAL